MTDDQQLILESVAVDDTVDYLNRFYGLVENKTLHVFETVHHSCR
jgi:hypothetical protein